MAEYPPSEELWSEPNEEPAEPVEEQRMPDSSEPRRRGGRRTAVIAVVVAAVVVVGALGGLYVLGIGPFAHPSSSGGQILTEGQTYSQAWAAANSSATAYAAGPWSPFLASGIDVPSSIPESTSITSVGASGGCTATPVGSAGVIEFDGFSGNYLSGQAANWIFFASSSSGSLVAITVVDGQANVVDSFPAQACAILGLLGTLPVSTSDSPAVLTAFGSAGGSDYLSGHPGGSLVFTAASLLGTGGWGVDYSTCPPVGTATGSYADYHQSFGLVDPVALGSAVSSTVSACDGLNFTNSLSSGGSGAYGPIQGAVALGTVSATANASAVVYSAPVSSSTAGLTWNELSATIASPSAGTANIGLAQVNILSFSGCTIATGYIGSSTYTSATSGGCSGGVTGGAALVTPGEIVAIVSDKVVTDPTAAFELSGAPDFSGSVNASLPAAAGLLVPITTIFGISAVTNGTSGAGDYYAVTVTSASGGLTWQKLAFEIVNMSSGKLASAPYGVNIYAASGCGLDVGSINSTLYIAPFTGACSSGTGGQATVLVGDVISIPSLSPLTGATFEWVAIGENPLDGSLVKTVP